MSRSIPLGHGRVTLVDAADYDQLARWKWHIAGPGYAAGYVVIDGVRTHVYLHRHLLNAAPGQIVDHIDGNPLNNTRANLRLVNKAQNQWNRKAQTNGSGHKGVCWHRRKQKYYARIQVNGRRYFLGYFATAEAAAEAYATAAQRLFGVYARVEA